MTDSSNDGGTYTITKWSIECSRIVGRYFDHCQSIFASDSAVEPDVGYVLHRLNINCVLASESCYLLLPHRKFWEVEIVLRSVIEGTFKFIFLCLGDAAERQVKLREYWEDLPQITRIKSHQRLERFLGQVDDPNAERWRPFRELLLDKDELMDLRERYPGNKRRTMEHRWSFNELARAMTLPEAPDLDFSALAFNYGLSSHLIHQDADAVGLVLDRLERDEERREALDLAHAARQLSDLVATAQARTVMLQRLYDKPRRQIRDLCESHESFDAELRQASRNWHEVEYGSKPDNDKP